MTPTFGLVRFGATNGIAPLSTGVPPASYPGAIATNAQLTVAVDRLQTRLTVPLSATDTLMQVQSGAGIVASCLMTIDNEIVQVLSGSGTSWTISRGFDGTAPALHLGSSVVSGFVDAWHHNALVAEVQAIEQALGPNLNRIPSVPFVVSTSFNFPVAQPGGNLVVGANVITLSPVPLGVNGSDPNHYLYIAGGTGAAEAVPIIGGTAVGGAASGTVIVTCANTHSGAWQISSATAGIQEAIIAGAGKSVYIPAGAHNTYATVSVPTTISPEIYGAGTAETVIVPQFTVGDVISYTTGNSIASFSLHDIAVVYPGAAASGAAFAIRGMSGGLLANVRTYGGFDGVSIEGGNGCFTTNLHIVGPARYGVLIRSFGTPMGGRHSDWTVAGGAAMVAGLRIQVDAGGAIAGMQFDVLSLQLGQYNINIVAASGPANEMIFSNVILDSATAAAVLAFGAGGGNGLHFDGVRGATAGGGCFDIYSGFTNFSIVNGSIGVGAGVATIVLRGVHYGFISNLNVSGGGTGGPNDVALLLTSDTGPVACDSIRIQDSSFGFSGTGLTTGNVSTGGLYINTTGHRNILISDSSFFGTTGNIISVNDAPLTFAGWIRGLSDTIPSVASGAAVTFPTVAHGGTVEITGTAAVGAVAGLYKGQAGFIKTAGAVPFTAGASIGSTVTTTPNTITPFWFDGTKLYLR